jgi:hypothetical protein
MNFMVPLALFGWVPLSIYFFSTRPAHRAVLYTVIGGVLFLPMTGYNLPGFPDYTKETAIALGLILGGRLSGKRQQYRFQWNKFDVPMAVWCICPLFSSVSNGLGIYDGFSASLGHIITWGVPFLAGRIYFRDESTIKDLHRGIIIGGLIYMVLSIYEIRMSPQLNNMLYGFFPHSWVQHVRYGGFRPIVFMQHGLMVALWMASTSTLFYWAWRSRIITQIKGIPAGLLTAAMVVTTILCKSVNGYFFLGLGIASYHLIVKYRMKSFMLLLVLLTPLYIGLRMTNQVSSNTVIANLEGHLHPDRIESLGIRLHQENLFVEKTLQRPWLGWAGWGRGWPIDPERGTQIGMIDSMWLIAFNGNGLIGISSFWLAMILVPLLSLRLIKGDYQDEECRQNVLVLSMVIIFFSYDCLMNGMVNSVYIITIGAIHNNILPKKTNG